MKFVALPAFLSLSTAVAWALVPSELARAAPSPAEATVSLTHFSVTLTPETYAAFLASPMIAALAATEQRHTVAGSDSWTGFYIYGRQTYLEFFSEAELPADTRQGDCSIALGVEQRGTLSLVKKNLERSFGEAVRSDPVTRQIGVQDVPWFTSVSIRSAVPESNEIWFNEMDPDYLKIRYPAHTIVNPLSRQENLSAHFLADHWLDNVVELVSVASPTQTERFQKELLAAGWKIDLRRNGFSARGPGEILRFRTVKIGRTGIRAVKLSMTHFHRRERIRVGSTTFQFDGMTARLTLF